MRFLKVFVFCMLLFTGSVSFAQTPGSMTGFTNAMMGTTGGTAPKTSLTAEEKAQLQEQGQRMALTNAGYSEEQIAAYNAKMQARKEAIKSGNKANMPAFTEEEQAMSKVAYQASKKVNGQINKINKGLYDQNKSPMQAMSDWFNSKDWTGVENALDTAGAISMGVGVAALSAAGVASGAALVSGALGYGLAGITGAAVAWGMAEWLGLLEDPKTSFGKILNAFTSPSVGNGCWFCPIYASLFDMINSLTEKTNEGLREMIVGNGWGSFYSLMGILLFGYIIFVVGKAFISFEVTEPTKLVYDVFFPTMRCIIAALLIWNWQAIYTYMIDPLLAASVGFGQEVMSIGSESPGYSATADLTSGKYYSSACNQITSYNNTFLVDLAGGPTAHLDFSRKPSIWSFSRRGTWSQFYDYTPLNGGISNAVGGAILCFLDTASRNLIVWMAVGASFVADCWKLGITHFIDVVQMLIIGLIIFVGAFMIFLTFPLKLLDAMFRLMFVTALMPLWIAFWVIPQTRSFTKKAWDMLLNVMFTFLILSVVLMMVLTIIEKLFTKDISGVDIKLLVEKLSQDEALESMDDINFTNVGIFMTAALMYLAFSLIGKAESFVDHFAGGGGPGGFGKDLGAKATALTQKSAVAAGAGVAAGWRALTKKKEKEPSTPTTPPAPHKEFTPPVAPKPSVSTSSFTEKMPDGKMKETAMKSYTDANGRVTHKEANEVIKNSKGEVESKKAKRENFDVVTGNKTGSTVMETRYNKDGTATQLKTDYDAMDRKKSTLETTNHGTIKTEFDDIGREKKVTMKERDGTSSVQTNYFDSAGTLASYIQEVKDKEGKLIEKFKMNVKTGVKTNLLKTP